MLQQQRIRAQIIDWEYPQRREQCSFSLFDLEDTNDLYMLILAFGNGTIIEMYAECETLDALAALRGLVQGTGGFVQQPLTADQMAQAWLYQPHAETYIRAGSTPAFVFLYPHPIPDAFRD